MRIQIGKKILELKNMQEKLEKCQFSSIFVQKSILDNFFFHLIFIDFSTSLQRVGIILEIKVFKKLKVRRPSQIQHFLVFQQDFRYKEIHIK